MASNITHYFFGRRLLLQLPKNLQDNINQNIEHFDIGQQGPDPFFFHLTSKEEINPGTLIHQGSLYDFYSANKNLLEELPYTSSIWAYFIGFICHFSLDICIHPQISILETKLSIDHMLMETELDRQILLEEDLEPTKFLSRNLIAHPKKVSDTMYKLYKNYKGVRLQTIKESLYFFRIIEMLFHVSNKRQEKNKEILLRKLGLFEKYGGKILSIEPHPESAISTPILRREYERALDLAEEIILYFVNTENKIDIPNEIFLDFNGEIIQ